MTEYNTVIVGGGPIGASTAYFLSQQSSQDGIALITNDPEEDPTQQVTYRYAGGSVRWFWDEDEKREATTITAKFINELLDKGIELSALKDTYHFVYRGVHTPSLNIKSAELVKYFLTESAKQGVTVQNDTQLESIEKSEDGYILNTSKGQIKAKKVLLALGVNNVKYMPGLELENEKRQLFVTDVPVDEFRAKLPHTILKFDDAYGYVFLKKIDGVLKVVVGQEDLVEDEDETQAVDYYKQLMDSPFGDAMPWLKDAKVEKLLWGVDAATKTLLIKDDGQGLYSANCGSSVRSCVYIGQQLSQKLI